jgi:hypothetical protein
MGKTLGTYDPRAGEVVGFAEVKFYGFDRTPAAELRSMGEAAVRQRLPVIETEGWQAEFDAGTVDPLGLSELTNKDDGPDFLYVVDLHKKVDGVEEAAATLTKLAEASWGVDVRQDST